MNPALETLALAYREHGRPRASCLFLGAEPHPDFLHAQAWQPLKPLADECVQAGMNLVDAPQGKFDTLLFLPGKSKDEILAGFALACDCLADGGMLIVSLPNSAGAARFEKELSRVAPLLFSVSKHKCRAFGVSNSGVCDESILSEWRELGKMRKIADTDFTVQAGVFSANHIDPGSALLSDSLPASLRGQVADLGAGWGYLSRMVLQKCPNIVNVDLFEVDARAIACARHNVAGAATFHWHDVTKGLANQYDYIITNPPFHSGQAMNLDLGRAFLSVAANSLKRGGTLHLVANRQLPYEAHLSALGLRSRIVAETHAFKVIFSS
jgi:16S rRNA (guanine1207-N2)-methyltransferase